MAERTARLIAIGLCVFLCGLYALVAWSAVSGKSATVDEPSHAATGWFNLYAHDFRLSPDVPTPWEEWIGLGIGPDAIHYDASSASYRDIRIRRDLTAWDVRVIYETPGNDGIAIVRRARAMALILAVALAALIGRWAWELGGPVAAVTATALYCLDPNFLGHGALVKNDVAITFAYLAGAYALWRVGRRLTWLRALAVLIAVAAAIGVKFSGLLLAPVMLVVLGFRAINAEPWIVVNRVLVSRSEKAVASGLLVVVTAIFTYATIWAGDDFRFDAGPNGLRLDTGRFLDVLRDVQTFTQHNRPPTPDQLAAWKPSLMTRALLFAESHKLLPEAWIDGMIMTQSGSESRLCFLAGQFYNGGKWYFFPAAALFKAPLATIIAVVLALSIGVGAGRRGLFKSAQNRWNALAMVIPAAAYATAAITSNVNIGLRHAFPVYPFVFIAVGLAVARVWPQGPVVRAIAVLLLGGLGVETAAAYPNYIDFFSVAVGGSSAGYDLLSDSNLDWGQDLPLLKQWQEAHPTTPLYLDYFGRCDPAAYGIEYFNLPDENGKPSYEYGPPPVMPNGPGVIAVSATYLHLARAYAPPPQWLRFIHSQKPQAILGGSIYLFAIEDRMNAEKRRR
jgi:4-amino-4-deoxy-L-arabinose transferase-like glycosyltransferase